LITVYRSHAKVGGIRRSFNNKGNGTQDFSNSIIIINGGWRRNPILNLCASIALAASVIWIVEAYIIGLGTAARVVLCLRYSTAYANHLFSLSQGKP